MTEMLDPVAYYNEQAAVFAAQASSTHANRFEYQDNMPALLNMCSTLGGDVLDFGCGAGNFTALLKRPDRTVEGCDSSPRLLAIAHQSYPDIHFLPCDTRGRVATGKLYNLIMAKLVFHYVLQLDPVLIHLRERLHTGGHLLISVPHPDKTNAHFATAIDEGVYEDEVGNFGLRLQMVHRTLGRLSALLTDSHFIITSTVVVSDNNAAKRLNILAQKAD